jgi:hypothetical protein
MAVIRNDVGEGLGMVAHAYNPISLGGRDREDSLKPPQANKLVRPYLNL